MAKKSKRAFKAPAKKAKALVPEMPIPFDGSWLDKYGRVCIRLSKFNVEFDFLLEFDSVEAIEELEEHLAECRVVNYEDDEQE